MDRREFMGAVAAAAFADYETKDYGPEDIEEWDDPSGGYFRTGRADAYGGILRVDVPIDYISLGMEDADEGFIEAGYDDTDVMVDANADATDGMSNGALLKLEPDEARALAVAIWQAAWEFENRPGTNNPSSTDP